MMLPPLTLPNPETVAFLQAISTDEEDYQADILQARRYNDGQQFVALTDRLREFLGGDASNDQEDWKRLRLNICRIVLTAVVDKLIVSGFDTDEQPRQEIGPDGEVRTVKPVAAYAWRLWQACKMDSKQRTVHQEALRDSEAFVIVDWDNTRKRPRFTPHQRFIDQSIDSRTGADVGDGCKAYYRNDDPDQDLLFVTKRWTEVSYPMGNRTTRQRLTVYYADRIEKYAGFPGAWKRTVDSDTEPWPIPWLDRQGRPLGIPVAHFRSTAGMEAREAWPLQNAINKALVDLMAESDIAAFRILAAFGWKPVDSDGNALEIEPGTWVGSESKDGRIQEIAGADLTQFLNVIDSLMLKAAIATDTPAERFVTTRQVSSEGTQKEQNAPLLNKARSRQGDLGDGWESLISIAVRLENTFGRGGLAEDVGISTQWQPLEARDEKAELEQAKLRKDLGMPVELVAEGLGLSPAQIDLWRAELERRQETAAAISAPQGDGNAAA